MHVKMLIKPAMMALFAIVLIAPAMAEDVPLSLLSEPDVTPLQKEPETAEVSTPDTSSTATDASQTPSQVSASPPESHPSTPPEVKNPADTASLPAVQKSADTLPPQQKESSVPEHILKLPSSAQVPQQSLPSKEDSIPAPDPKIAAVKAAPPQPKPVTAPATKTSVDSNVVVRVGEHQDFDRIVFDWPRVISYKVSRDARHTVIHFSANGKVQLSATSHLSRGHNFASAEDTDGHLTVSFETNPNAEVKDFANGPSIVIDILNVPKKNVEKEPTINPVTPAKEAPKQATPEVESAPAVKSTEVPISTSSASPVKVPADKQEPTKPIVAPATAISVGTTAAVIVKQVPESSPQLLKAVEEKHATPPTLPPQSLPTSVETKQTTPSPIGSSASPVIHPTPNVASKPVGESPKFDVGTKPLLIATLDPHTPVRSAVWLRGGYGTIIFDRKLTLTPEALSEGSPASLVALEALNLPAASGFRFPVPDSVELHATREGTAWKLFLTKQLPDVPVSATLVAQPDFALGARYLLPLPDAPEPIRYTDPVVGDDLIIVPLSETQAFSVPRRMADFQIWAAAQGLVIKPTVDKLNVRVVSDGIEISSDSGLHLSPSIETGESQQSSQKARSAAAGKSIFNFAVWRGKSDETFTQSRQRLQQTIVDVPERERNRARLELARFYFARGYGAESLALLNYLVKEIPDLATHSDFLALSGAAKISSNRPEDGLKDLDAANIADQPEIKLWQAAGLAEMRNWTDAEDKFAATEALLAGYPEPFYSHFFILAIESAIAVGNNREAAEWLDILETSNHDPGVNPAIQYLHGVLHANSGRAQAAAMAWKNVSASNDRLYRVRADMALIDLGVANQSLTPAQAADRLEALRFAWRGDDLEVDILHRLGEYYIQAKNVKAGLGILAQATQLYPQSPLTPKIKTQMSDTFRDVFLGELGKKLSPLEALTLYQQYRDTLMPTGDDGIAVTRNLAERLAAIDLMDQAGNLLEDIAVHKLSGNEKGRVTARLAAIRLIDHKPQQALDALDLSTGDFLSAGLQRERVLLRAKALSQLHREDEALAVLKDDNRFPAKILRADTNMHAQHWEEAAKNLLDLVGDPPRPGETLRNDQADWLVRCAIAMAMTGDQVGLDKLAIDYGAAMAGTTQNSTFRILVEPEKSGQLKDIAAAQSRISGVDMFQSFLDTYRKTDDGGEGQGDKKP